MKTTFSSQSHGFYIKCFHWYADCWGHAYEHFWKEATFLLFSGFTSLHLLCISLNVSREVMARKTLAGSRTCVILVEPKTSISAENCAINAIIPALPCLFLQFKAILIATLMIKLIDYALMQKKSRLFWKIIWLLPLYQQRHFVRIDSCQDHFNVMQ